MARFSSCNSIFLLSFFQLDLLISTDHSEPLFLAYSIMETMLLPAVANCVEAVKIFATEEHVKIVSKLLELLGPANASTLPTQRLFFTLVLWTDPILAFLLFKHFDFNCVCVVFFY